MAPIPCPLIGNDVGRRLPPRVVAVLRKAGIRTLAEMTLREPRRKRWWRGIAGLSKAMAQQVEGFFAAHAGLTERARALETYLAQRRMPVSLAEWDPRTPLPGNLDGETGNIARRL